MEIIQGLVIKTIAEPSIKKPILSTEDRTKKIKELFRENSEIYKRAKKIGKASFEDRNRYLEIRMELIYLKAI